jgi:DNA-directed RNA polymerase specialized sigma24 family protein
MSDITHILNAIDQGDPHAAEQLLPLVHDELRELAAAHMAREEPGHALDATALVHEAYLRLSADDPAAAALARLRLFAGLSIEESAAALHVSRASAFRDWSYARAVLTAALADENNSQKS